MSKRQPKSGRSRTKAHQDGELSSLTERAYAQLEKMIATLELRPGAFVSETELCERLGIGRTPVREAMQRLARDNLLLIMPRRGCVVADCRFGDELKVIEVRQPLEIVVARGAATRATPEQRSRFSKLADNMVAALKDNDFDAFARLDVEFNELCLVACCNPAAASMMRLISTQNRRFWFMHHGRNLPQEGVEGHVEMARAIASGDPDQAAKASERLLAYLEAVARRAPLGGQ